MTDADEAAGGTNPTEIRANLSGQDLQDYNARSQAHYDAMHNHLMDAVINRFGGNITNQQQQQFRDHADANRQAYRRGGHRLIARRTRPNQTNPNTIHESDRAAGGGMAR